MHTSEIIVDSLNEIIELIMKEESSNLLHLISANHNGGRWLDHYP